MQRWFTMYFFDIWHHVMINWHLSNPSYPLTSTTWPYRGLKFIARWGQCFIKVDSCQVKLLKTSWVVRKPVNSNLGLKVNQIITVSSIEFFFQCAAFVLCIGFVIIKFKIEGQTIYRKPHTAKLQNSNQNSTSSWVRLIRLQELRF